MNMVYINSWNRLVVVTLAVAAVATHAQALQDDPTKETTHALANSISPYDLRDFKEPPGYSVTDENRILLKYQFLDPQKLIPTDLLKHAVLYYDFNINHTPNVQKLTIVDFSQFSGDKRMFILDMKDGSVLPIHVAHGRGSDLKNTGFAGKFSNINGSETSSVGFYLTGEVYVGEHGRSLRLDGLSSTNSNVRKREVVIHGATYVNEGDHRMGRSWGCLAVSFSLRDRVIEYLSAGSLIFVEASQAKKKQLH
jgi:hypothetical protein